MIDKEAELTVLLPAYNEEVSIGRVLDDIEALPIKCNVVVVDSESTDRTPELVKNRGVTLIDGKRGKGNAVREALRYVKTPYIAMLDADGTYPVEALMVLPEMLKWCDVVKGCRKWHADGAMPGVHKFGNYALSLLASILYGRRVADVCSGLWAFRRESLDVFSLTSRGFTLEVDLFANTARNNLRLAEIPIFYGCRTIGDKPKLRIGDGFKIGWFLLKRRFR